MPITQEQIDNAGLDVVSLEDVVNGPDNATVVTRLGRSIKTLARVIKELSEQDIGGSAAALINQRLNDAGMPSAVVYNDSWNDIDSFGVYWSSSANGRPSTPGQFIMLHLQALGGRAYQLAFDATSPNSTKTWIRFRTSTATWTQWTEVATANALALMNQRVNEETNNALISSLTAARPDLNSLSAVVIRQPSGEDPEVLFEWGSNAQFQPASLIKILTSFVALTVLDNEALDWESQSFTVASEDVTIGSGNNLLAGDTLTVKDLIINLLLPSSNTSAMVLARECGLLLLNGSPGDPVARFVTQMNAYATIITGGSETVVKNPSGLADAAQLTTARDMAKITLYVGADSRIASVWGLGQATLTISGANPRSISVESSVELAGTKYVSGGKTGTLTPGLHNLALMLDYGDGVPTAYVGMRGNTNQDRYNDARSCIAHTRPRDKNELGAYAIQASPVSSFDSLTISGVYGSATATDGPVPGTHIVVEHQEWTEGRAYQTASWGEVVTGTSYSRNASRFRSSSGVWSDWATTGGHWAQRLVNSNLGRAYLAGDTVKYRLPRSSFYEMPFDDIYVTAADIIARYQELADDFPDYVTGTQLGVDAWGNPIMEWTFNPGPIQGNHIWFPTNVFRHPKIGVTSLVHPGERPSAVATFLFFNDLCRNWQKDEMLADLRWNCTIVLVAPVNPSGINLGHQRLNGNGVDINRNFPFEWNTSTEPNKGPSAASELETQIMMNWPSSHEDAFAFVDHHSSENAGYALWYGFRPSVLELVHPIARKQHAWLKQEVLHDKLNVSSLALSRSGSGYMVSQWAEVDGRQAFFLEGPMPNVTDITGIPATTQRTSLVRQLTFTLHQLWLKALSS